MDLVKIAHKVKEIEKMVVLVPQENLTEIQNLIQEKEELLEFILNCKKKYYGEDALKRRQQRKEEYLLNKKRKYKKC